jgi:hypothetical protein
MLGSLWHLGSTRVAAFTVHEPPATGGTRLEQADRLLFVRDGFSWRAALFSPLYLIVRGEWLALAAYAGAGILALAVLNLVGASADWYGWTWLLLNVVTGFEASEIKRWSLGRAGWRELASVSGRGLEEAERRFYEAWLPTAEARPSVPSDHGTFPASIHPAEGDTVSHIETGLRRFSQSLRTKFATRT